jgi:hypothetical protein
MLARCGPVFGNRVEIAVKQIVSLVESLAKH